MSDTARRMSMSLSLVAVLLVGCLHDQPNGRSTSPSAKGASGAAGKSAPANAFYVYADEDSAHNQFSPTGWLGDFETAVDFQANSTEEPRFGKSCIKVSYDAGGDSGWFSLYWLYPSGNWGKAAGRNIEGATRLTFWARGQKGGEVVSFKMGGVPGPNADSAEAGMAGVTLTSSWEKFSIDLSKAKLTNIVGGFACTVTRADNPKGCTFYLDDILYELPR